MKRKTWRTSRSLTKRVHRRGRRFIRSTARSSSRRKILNVASVKKRDACVPANLSSIGYQSVNSGDFIMWCATARSLQRDTQDILGFYPNEAVRTASRVYWRGVRENINITTNDSSPWFWRRICFERKGQFDATAISPTHYLNIESPLSRQQITYNRSTTPLSGPERDTIRSWLFEGTQQIDYFTASNAPTNKRNLRVLFDRLVTINSGSGNGVVRKFKYWHPMNKTMTYFDYEAGQDIGLFNPFANAGDVGMGDYYIVDIFESASGFSGTLSFLPEATLFWHER